MTSRGLGWMSARNSGLMLATAFTAIFFISPFIASLEGASGKTQEPHSNEHGIGITSPLSSCVPEAGCTQFPGDWPALYTQMVSTRSFVVTLDDVTPAELTLWARRHLPSYMVPSQWYLLTELPASANNKVDRNLLLSQFQNGEYRPG